MANLKSAQKRARTNQKKRMRNQSFLSKMRSSINKVRALIEADELEQAKTAYNETVRIIDRAIQKGIVHQNNGNRQKSRLAKQIRTLSED